MDLQLGSQIVMVLLAVVGFLIVRLIRGIDETTRAISDLNLTVSKLGVVVGSQKDRIDQIERQTKTNWDSHQTAIELSRTRYHELINMINGNRLQIEMIKKDTDNVKHLFELRQ